MEDLGFTAVEARNAVSSLLQYLMEPVEVTPEMILDADEISAEKNHDVYDCFHVALAREAGADKIVTTDRDFEQLCEDEPFAYTNPVPEDVLSEFDTTTSFRRPGSVDDNRYSHGTA